MPMAFQRTAANAAETQYFSQGEVLKLFEAAIGHLKDSAFYCIVDNQKGRDKSATQARGLLLQLADAVAEDTTTPAAGNLKNLLRFVAYSTETVKKTGNSAVAQELLSILEPIREAML
jgi:hypothetical protein